MSFIEPYENFRVSADEHSQQVVRQLGKSHHLMIFQLFDFIPHEPRKKDTHSWNKMWFWYYHYQEKIKVLTLTRSKIIDLHVYQLKPGLELCQSMSASNDVILDSIVYKLDTYLLSITEEAEKSHDGDLGWRSGTRLQC